MIAFFWATKEDVKWLEKSRKSTKQKPEPVEPTLWPHDPTLKGWEGEYVKIQVRVDG